MPSATNRAECHQEGDSFTVTILTQWASEFQEYAQRAGHGHGEAISNGYNITIIRYANLRDLEAFKAFCKRWQPLAKGQ